MLQRTDVCQGTYGGTDYQKLLGHQIPQNGLHKA